MFRDKNNYIQYTHTYNYISLDIWLYGIKPENISKGIEEHGVDIALVSESKDSSIVDFFKNDSEFNIIETKIPKNPLKKEILKH